MRNWTLAQCFAVGVGLFTLTSGLVGMAINPSFATGQDATAEVFIVDWNGWHAVAAILVGLPGLAIAWLPQYAVPYLAYRAISDAGTGLWAAFDDRPLGVLYLPSSSDAILHAALAAVAALGILLGARGSRRVARAA